MEGSITQAALESSFLEETRELSYYRAKLVILFGILLVPLFSGLDYIIANSHVSYFLSLRLFNVFENFVLLTILIFHKKISLTAINIIVLIVFVSVGILIAYMCRVLGGYDNSYYAGIILLILSIGLVMPWNALWMLANCTTVYLAYVLLAYTPNASSQDLINNSYFLISTIFMGVTSTYLGDKLRFKEFSNRQKLKNANERLLSLDQAKTRFFTNMTHEFRTPLVSLDAVLQMIQEQIPKSHQLAPLLKSSQYSLTVMIENINDLLSKTRSEHDMLQMRWSRVNAVELTQGIVDIFVPIANKQKTELSFQNRLSSANGESTTFFPIDADRSKFNKILGNLIGNAVKFTPAGKIEVLLESNSADLIIKVRDTGIGIPQEELDKVFQPFVQASNNSLRDVQGTGLGLSIVRDFVEAHHGQVSIESTVGKGTALTVLLPLKKPEIPKEQFDWSDLLEETPTLPIELHLPSFENLNSTFLSRHQPERANLLIIEDNLYVLQALAHVLGDDHNLRFAQDGEEGLALIHEIKPDLIISDIMMPKKNGYELLSIIKQDPELRHIPVILLTAKADLPSKLEGLEQGADEYISKPFNNREVRTRVKNLLERKKMELELIQAEKMISLGQLIAGISHEILNPISYAKSAVTNLSKFLFLVQQGQMSFEQAWEKHFQICLEDASDGIRRVCEIVSALRGLVRQGSRGFNSYEIHEGIDSTLKILHADYKAHVQIHRHYRLESKVDCKINQLNQVFLNLLSNAIQSLQDQAQGNIWIETFQEGEEAVITIRDDGTGIPKEFQSKIFSAFFTTKDIGQGMGLGLYISERIIHEHQGTLTMQSVPGQGAQFTIRIPMQQTGGVHDDPTSIYDRIDRRVSEIRYPHHR